MKQLCLLLCLFLSVSTALAQYTDTDELLDAPNAKEYIQLWPDFVQKRFYFSLDADKKLKQQKSVNGRLTIGVPKRAKEISVAIRYFNPLQYTVKMSDTLLDDPTFKSIGRLVSELTDLLKQVPAGISESIPSAPSVVSTMASKPPAPESSQPGYAKVEPNYRFVAPAQSASTTSKAPKASSKSASPSWEDIINEIQVVELAEWKYLSLSHRDCLDTTREVIRQLRKLDDLYFNRHFKDSLRTSLIQLSRQQNIQDLNQQTSRFKDQLVRFEQINNRNKDDLESFNSVTNTKPSNILKYHNKDSSTCIRFATYSLLVFKHFIRICSDNQRKRDRMLELSKKLRQELETAINSADRKLASKGEELENSFILGRYNILDESMRNVDIGIYRRSMDLNEDFPQVTETDDKIVAKLRIRSSQTLIPEFSSGIYFTKLSYPNYGVRVLTADDAANLNAKLYGSAPPDKQPYKTGQTVVDTVGEQRYPVVLAGMLNMTMNIFEGLVHPLIQIGVGTGKNRPTLLAGAGLRLRWKRPVVITGGAVWAWKRQLDGFRQNQLIASENVLDQHLRYELDPKSSFYLGIQTNF